MVLYLHGGNASLFFLFWVRKRTEFGDLVGLKSKKVWLLSETFDLFSQIACLKCLPQLKFKSVFNFRLFSLSHSTDTCRFSLMLTICSFLWFFTWIRCTLHVRFSNYQASLNFCSRSLLALCNHFLVGCFFRSK